LRAWTTASSSRRCGGYSRSGGVTLRDSKATGCQWYAWPPGAWAQAESGERSRQSGEAQDKLAVVVGQTHEAADISARCGRGPLSRVGPPPPCGASRPGPGRYRNTGMNPVSVILLVYRYPDFIPVSTAVESFNLARSPSQCQPPTVVTGWHAKAAAVQICSVQVRTSIRLPGPAD
jgi:hypothetical protein